MTPDEFINKLKDAKIIVDRKSKSSKKKSNPKSIQEYFDINFSTKWLIGGVGGGSCWDDGSHDSHYSISPDEEPELTELDSILEEVCANISFLQYKKLCKELISFENSSYNEYYGNSSQYRTKSINLGKLYKYLKDNNLFQ